MTNVQAPEKPRVIGSELARHDAFDKVRGRTSYAADYALPRMLHAMLKRAELPHARITRLDVSAAKAIPGVVDVYAAADVPQNTVWVDVPGQTLEVGALKARSNVLADTVVRYYGEPVALVAAESADAALAALDAIEVDYEQLPALSDPARALDPDAPQVHEDGNLLAHWELEEGDVDSALATPDAAVVEHTYKTQFIDHAYLEPEAGTAWLDADGVITIRAATQVIEHFRDVARILRLPENRVRVIAPYVGGGFGGKEDMTVEPYLGLVVAKTGRPTTMVWTRSESLTARQNRHSVTMHSRTAATPAGDLIAQDIDILSDGGAYAFLSALVLLYATTCAAGPYHCPNVRVRSRVVYTNHTPCSAMRGFGGMQVAFGYEGQMDALAARLGIDPLELRRRNFVERGSTLPIGQTLETHVALPELTDAVEHAMGPMSEPSAPGLVVGRGYACNLQPYGRCVWLNDWSSAWIGFELDGTLVIRIGVPDIGAGQASALISIASEVLGVPPERCIIHIGDSALTPLTGTTTATRQLYMSGNAVLKASNELRAALSGVASGILEIAPADVEFDPDGVHDRGDPDRRIEFPALLASCAAQDVAWHRHATFHAPKGVPWRADESWRGRVFPDFTFGCHGIDVEVDVETGMTRVLRYVAAHDVGQAINLQSVQGQIEGAVAMGLGFALSEELVFEEAQNLTTTFAQYLMPTAVEVPDIEPVVLQSGSGVGPFNARGIGEPPIGPPAPAVAAALRDATGIKFDRLPMSPERVALAMEADDGQG
jgi:xanthine dehydrogenase molybdenum-binding subunit